MFQGVRDGHFHVVGDFIGRVFRSSTRGASPSNRGVIDFVYLIIGLVRFTVSGVFGNPLTNMTQFGIPPWRNSVDDKVRDHIPEHQTYLKERGLKK